MRGAALYELDFGWWVSFPVADDTSGIDRARTSLLRVLRYTAR